MKMGRCPETVTRVSHSSRMAGQGCGDMDGPGPGWRARCQVGAVPTACLGELSYGHQQHCL